MRHIWEFVKYFFLGVIITVASIAVIVGLVQVVKFIIVLLKL
jgi:hypothetical protein